MTRRILAGFATALLTAAIAAAQNLTAQDAGYSCSGVVVRAGTRQPLNHVLVTISSTTEKAQEAMFLTSTDGRFAFAGLGAGKYRLSARKEGYAQQFFQGRELGLSTAVVLGPGLGADGIVFEMHTPATLSGTVSDENGDPVRGQVYLFEKGVFLGRTGFRRAGQQQMKARGEFLFDQLHRGTYFVAVTGRPWFADGATIMRRMVEAQLEPLPVGNNAAFPITYYAGATDPDGAVPIDLREGGEAKIQIALHSEPTVRVTIDLGTEGDAGGPQQPQTGANFSVTGLGGAPIMVDGMFNNSNGQIMVLGLVRGRYQVSAHRFMRGKQENLGTRTVDLHADGRIDLSSLAKTEISGHLTMEQGAPPRQTLTVYLTDVNAGAGSLARVQPDGSFVFENPPSSAGSYELRLTGAQGVHLKTVGVTGARYEYGRLEVGEAAKVQLSLTASGDATKVEGLALKSNRVYAGALVLLIAEDPKQPVPVYRDQSDGDGSFELVGVVPGRYRLLAIDNGVDLPYLEPKAMQPYLATAQNFEIGPQGVASVKVAVQTRLK
jgi:hypothetical protein